MFRFNKESGCTKVWITLIVGGVYTYDQVPELLNLKECVGEVLKEMGMMKDKK